MANFAFGLCTIMVVIVIIILLAYLFLILQKKYYVANSLLSFFFLHCLISLMTISWGLISINDGFDIIWQIDVDFTMIYFFAAFFIVVVALFDYKLRKAIIYPKHGFEKVMRIMLPALSMICFTAVFGLYYFVCHYYEFVITNFI